MPLVRARCASSATLPVEFLLYSRWRRDGCACNPPLADSDNLSKSSLSVPTTVVRPPRASVANAAQEPGVAVAPQTARDPSTSTASTGTFLSALRVNCARIDAIASAPTPADSTSFNKSPWSASSTVRWPRASTPRVSLADAAQVPGSATAPPLSQDSSASTSSAKKKSVVMVAPARKRLLVVPRPPPARGRPLRGRISPSCDCHRR
mmetsp:Transcript_66811/g.186477  ORF Transcript_66811/g.186477 Transcript_66811/m.186477 type:complete len:207 (-) Transcript_66811:15-635(-)